jgi:hypothetical protein
VKDQSHTCQERSVLSNPFTSLEYPQTDTPDVREKDETVERDDGPREDCFQDGALELRWQTRRGFSFFFQSKHPGDVGINPPPPPLSLEGTDLGFDGITQG